MSPCQSSCDPPMPRKSLCQIELQAVLFLRSPESSDMMQKLRRTRRPPARPECHPWIVTQVKCEQNSSARKMLKRERDWRFPAFRLVGAVFFPRGKCRITCLAGLWHSPSGRSWSGRGLLELCFFCISFAISEGFCWKSCNRDMNVDVDDKIKNDNIKDPTSNAFCTMSMLFWFCLPGGLRARKASWWQVWNGMNMYFFHVFNRTKRTLRFAFWMFSFSIWSHKDWCLDPRGSRSPTAHGSEVMWRCFLKKLHPTFATGVLLVYYWCTQPSSEFLVTSKGRHCT